MRPERRGTRPAPADSTPPGPLRSPVQTAGSASLFCFLLPGVHAADVGAPTPHSSFSPPTGPAPVPAPPPSALPTNIGKPEFPDTGWERIKELFSDDKTKRRPEELVNIVKLGVLGAATGFLYGGLPAARFSRQRYIELSQAEVYTSRVEAVRSAQNAAVRGFLRYGWRWSWRVTLIATLFSSVNTGLSVYRDKEAVSHYVAAGVVTLGLYRFHLGLRGMVAGSVFGVILGAPIGAVVIGLQKLAGETLCEKRRRERREIYELKLEEWAARLQVTDELISSLSDISEAEETSRDLRRVQELLASPRNAEGDHDSGS